MDSECFFSKLMGETGRSVHLTARGLVFKGYLVGFKSPEYLVIEVPRSAEIDAGLYEGHAVTGLFFAAGTAVGFQSTITALLKKPAWLLFVKYPSSLEKIRNLRSSNRVECNLPCTLLALFNLKQYSGTIVDITASGCKCLLTSIPPAHAKMFDTEKKVLLEFDFGRGKTKCLGEVSNLKREGTTVSLGVRFCDNDETTLRELNVFVLGQVKSCSSKIV
jgi:hypothetical protein